MTLVPAPYLFTAKDENAIKVIGYQITNLGRGNIDLFTFMQSIYPNFNLLRLLQVIEEILTRVTSLPIHRKIYYNTTTGELLIDFRNEFTTEEQAVVFQRTFYKETTHIIVSHDYFVLPSTHQRQGLAQPVFQESLQQYINVDVFKILVHAGLSGGGYTWAKHGFTITNRSEVDDILAAARKQLFPAQIEAIEKVYNHYYNNPDPVFHHKAFPVVLWANIPFMKPVLMGSDWHGELNLKNEEQLTNFTNYVFRS